MIRIQNIYYMLAYAFNVLNEDGFKNIAEEEFEYASDLFAAILAKGIAVQIKRGLNRDYTCRTEAVSLLQGKIDVSSSIRQLSMIRKKLICDFDEFTENSYMNKILKTTAMLLIKSSDVSAKQKKELKKVIHYFSGVEELNPYMIQWSAIRYNRNNATYKMLLNICYLVIKGMLLTEQDGSLKLVRYLDNQLMHRLYEKFVLEYYRKHYPEFNASPSYIDWNVGDSTIAIEYLPVMKSDITLEYNGKTLIIDTKYYEHTMQTYSLYNSQTIHSNNLYQIFTYVKNKDKTNSGNVSGILLYAKTDEEIVPDCEYIICGNRIYAKTLDLSVQFLYIANQLNQIGLMIKDSSV